mmetsp:Transcript_38802/g.102602  ORF Transcript_38802/g.102602 Transcript_38802/m.102602 type:complete len:89 (+) Transcript_38802:1-267(+)
MKSKSKKPWRPPRISEFDFYEGQPEELSYAQKYVSNILKALSVVCLSKAVLITVGLMVWVVVGAIYFGLKIYLENQSIDGTNSAVDAL